MRKKSIRRTIGFGVAAVAWVGVLFFFSGQTGTDSGALSKRVTEILFGWLIRRGWSFEGLHILTRKLAHFGIFAVEGGLLGFSLLSAMRARWAVPLTALACGAMAVLNELHQTQVDGRMYSRLDIGIDFCGAMIGLIFAAILYAICTAKRNKVRKYITTGD